MKNINPSPTRTYVIMVNNHNYTRRSFRQFLLPEYLENTCKRATQYFYNNLDSFSCGESAYPIEMHNDITVIGKLEPVEAVQ